MRRLWLKLGVVVFWCGWPALWLYLHNSRRTRLLLICNGEFLVLRGWIGAGNWGLPGGGLHKGEKPVYGLIREVKEETGLELTKTEPIYLLSGKYTEYGFRCDYDVFVLTLNQKPEIHIQRGEIVDFRWQAITNPEVRLSQDAQEALNGWLSKT